MQKVIQITILIFFFIPGFSQSDQPNGSEYERLTSIATEMMTEAGLCGLITYDTTGKTNVRTMQPFPPEENLVVWFGTTSRSRKVQDIKNNPEVVLYYPSPDASGYVVLYGKAILINDSKLKEKYWMESWEDFYPDRSHYLLIKVVPESLEILNTRLGITGDTITWKVPSIDLK